MISKKSLGIPLLLSSCSSYNPYIEYEHISSIPNGTPFNNRQEDQVDQVYVVVQLKEERCYLDLAVGSNLSSSDIAGRNPFGRTRAGCFLFKDK